MRKTDKISKRSQDNTISMSSTSWFAAGIKDGSLILEEKGIRLNASVFDKDMPQLVKKAQSYQSASDAAAIGGLPGSYYSGMPGQGVKEMLRGTKGRFIGGGPQTVYQTSRIGDMALKRNPAGTKSLLQGVQGAVKTTGQVAGAPIARNAPTAGVRMGLNQPFSAAASEYAAARAGTGGVSRGVARATGQALIQGGKAIPQAAGTTMRGLAGAAASGGIRGAVAGGVIGAAGSIGAWAIHQGLMAAYDWSRGANDIPGALRTPRGAQDFKKAQEVLAQKVMPMMYGQASGPNEKLDSLNSYMSSLVKQLENDPGYQAAISGQIKDVMAPAEPLPEDLSTPEAGGGLFNPADQAAAGMSPIE